MLYRQKNLCNFAPKQAITMNEPTNLNNEIVIYQSEDGQTQLDVKLEGESVWLNRQQMAELFGRDVKTIGKHINNALQEELNDGISTVANFATVDIVSSSSSFKALFICLPIVFISLPNNSESCCRFSHTVSFSSLTSSCIFPSLL